MNRYWSIFTKPWKTLSPEKLGELVSELGFNAVEFPLRPGFQVEPQNAERDLPRLNETLKQYGIRITSVASGTTENIFAACQAADIKLIRIMVGAQPELGFIKSMDAQRRSLDNLLPLCEKYGVTVGIQHHYGFGIFNTMEMRYLLNDYDPKYIGAVWDAAHSALAGELPEQAIDIIWDKLVLVNLKMAYYKRANGPEAEQAKFVPYFTTARQGAASWQDAADALNKRNYAGNICLPAEYTDEENVCKYVAEDLKYAKKLFDQ